MPDPLVVATQLDVTRLIDVWPILDPLDLALAESTSLGTDVPVLLLPVGMSARFSVDRMHLKVRLQPDAVHIDNLQRTLTADETAWGTQFWADAGTDRDAAWHRLVSAVGTSPKSVNRAMWIARWTNPNSAEIAPSEPDRRCLAMPDRWLLITWQGTTVVAHKVSEPVSPLLPVDAPKEATPLHEWLTNYDKAVEVGMAVTLDFTTPTSRVDLLLAVGLRSATSPDDSAAELERLLQSHRYSGGIEFLAQSTPTNNTPESRTSWRSDPDPAQAVASELDATGPVAGSNASVVAHALGADATAGALRALPNGDLMEQPHAKAMLQVLWPVTGGEFLEVLLTDNAGQGKMLPGAVERFARHHAADFVRARGPLPALRVGRQPYGLLPVTSMQRWAPHGAEPSHLPGLHQRLRSLWPFWEAALGSLPRVGQLTEGSAEGAARVVAQILGQSPVPDPTGYVAWSVLPPNFSWSIDPAMFTSPFTGDLAAGLIDVGWHPMIADTRVATKHPASVVCPAADEQTPARLRELLAIASDYEALKAFPSAPTDLLSQLVQRSLMRAMDRDIETFVSEFGDQQVAQLRITKAVAHATLVGDLDVVSASPLNLLTALDLGVVFAEGVATVHPEIRPETTIGSILLRPEFVNAVLPGGHTPAPEHGGAVEGLGVLAGLGPEELTLLLGETIDLYANRFDAWCTSLATLRLHTLRAGRPTGVHLGGYGWLVNVEARGRTLAVDVPDDGQGPVFDPDGDAGVVHAPSVQHAATAAVLRHADLGDRAEGLGAGDTERRFDLTSASARRARWLVESIEGGQPLAAVLGYRVERLLQDLGHADLIAPLREACPLVSGEPVDHAENALSIPPHDVVDGVTLWRRLTGDLSDGGLRPLPALPPQVFADLTFGVDALADGLVVEGIHHIVGGDHARAQATLTGLAHGESISVDLRSFDEMRDRLSIPMLLTALVTDADHPAAAGWSADRPRAQVAPAAEAFAQGLLPEPGDCVFTIERAGAASVDVSLAALQLCALDVVNDCAAVDQTDSLLEARVVAAAGAGAMRIVERAGAGTIGWKQLNALSRRVRSALVSARPLTSADLAIGGQPAPPSPAAADAVPVARDAIDAQLTRLGAAVTALRDIVEPLDEAETAAELDDAQRASTAAALAALEPFGVPGCVPRSGDDVLANARAAVARGAAAAAQRTALDDAGAREIAGAPIPPGQADGSVSRLAQIARAAFGEATVIAPLVDLPDAQLNVAPSAVELADWVGELAEVRKGTRVAHSMWLGSEALTGRVPQFVGLQFPVADGESWVGGYAGPAQAWTPPVKARRAMIVDRVGPAAATGAGIVIDSWVEEIPLPGDETTGLALNINASDARPPQSWLLAVPPDPNVATWRLGDLVATLTETLELARFRAAEPPGDLPHRHLLPMVYVPDGISGTQSFSEIFGMVLSSATISTLATAHVKGFGDAG